MSPYQFIKRRLQIASLRSEARQARPEAGARGRPAYHVLLPVGSIRKYREHVLGFVECLETLGRATVLHPIRRLKQAGRFRPGDRVIAFAPRHLEPVEPADGVLYVAINSEPDVDLPADVQQTRYHESSCFLASCHLVFECHEIRYAQAVALGDRPAGVLPFGYSRHWDQNATPEKPRYDVAFLGRLLTDHRRELWNAVRARFKTYPRTEAWGDGRVRLLRSARIQLSLSRIERPQLSGHRFALALANRCFLLSEPLPRPGPFRAGVHYAEATPASLIDTIDRFLKRDEERLQIARAGHDFFCQHFRLDGFVKRLLPVLDFAMETIRDGREPGLPEGEGFIQYESDTPDR